MCVKAHVAWSALGGLVVSDTFSAFKLQSRFGTLSDSLHVGYLSIPIHPQGFLNSLLSPIHTDPY